MSSAYMHRVNQINSQLSNEYKIEEMKVSSNMIQTMPTMGSSDIYGLLMINADSKVHQIKSQMLFKNVERTFEIRAQEECRKLNE
jgi:hypothetical protein